MGNLSSSEKQPSHSLEKAVHQPKKMESTLSTLDVKSVLETLDAIDSIAERVSERTGEDRSGDMGGAGAGKSQGPSPRDLAIANLPQPVIMQKQLEKHIRQEIKKLNKEAKHIARMSKPGAAYYLNELYSRIRRLNGLLRDLFEASVDIMKRLYIRVFIDKQPII